jgi:hypothetical protein
MHHSERSTGAPSLLQVAPVLEHLGALLVAEGVARQHFQAE